MTHRIAGILGGMGPEATVDLMSRVIRATPARDDADHVRMVVDNNPQVPSRIRALLDGDGESAGPCLQDMARRLEAWGADFLAMPCNTAHYYYPEIRRAVSIPVLNMLDLSAETIAREHPDIRTVGLLASSAILRLGLYEEALARQGLEAVSPRPDVQDALMAAIRRIKTGRYGNEVDAALNAAAAQLADAGAGVLLIACTELSVVADRLNTPCPVVDSAQVLAEAVVHEARRAGP
ncbi:aspartate/glutamate racemase family protein [Thioalkalivibrio denitrificans]|uniref:aspartate/glutamate racemase family protein n=1 Tax=Thioalkalivibrio denitrificans TaxID=108003 RepID=UPI001C37968B|nr:amino acid racemase [Thioalkalivibrio denitrificans]